MNTLDIIYCAFLDVDADQISVILGGIPAQYGDATGGIISATTKGPSRVFGMGIEFQSSGLGEGKGLDAYGYNRLGVNLNGPLLRPSLQKEYRIHKEKPVLQLHGKHKDRTVPDNLL